MDKPNPLRTASALALTAGTISLVSARAVFLSPGGMFFSTVLTLVVIPVLYALVQMRKVNLREAKMRKMG
jgi:Cu/Ag efflux pump CusA